MPFRIAVIPGDGIGPEVIAQGLRVLEAVTAATGTRLDRVMYDLGAERYLRTGEILPDAVFKELQTVDAIYLGAVGDPRVHNPQYAAGLLLRSGRPRPRSRRSTSSSTRPRCNSSRIPLAST